MPKLLPDAKWSQLPAASEHLLTGEHFEALTRCAQGISLRFEAAEIVECLVANGFCELGVAGVVTMTANGHQYLRTHRAEFRLVLQVGKRG